ncbi:MAG TPA: hypothetical protein VH475_02805 [Tepidisphaeraceae bacterium]|jgi:hypothetical protein
MATNTFSQAVLRGLGAHGLSEAEICRLAELSKSMFNLIVAGKKELAAGAMAKIEGKMGLTGGELAAQACEPGGGPLTKLMRGWAKVRDAAAATDTAAKRS